MVFQKGNFGIAAAGISYSPDVIMSPLQQYQTTKGLRKLF